METAHSPDITAGFIQMVDAFKVRPELEKEIADLKAQLEARQQEAEARERRMDQVLEDLATTRGDKERLTRERDEAMFRSLELEEKIERVSPLLAQITGLVNPPKVEPVPVETPPVQGVATSGDQPSATEGTVTEGKPADWSSDDMLRSNEAWPVERSNVTSIGDPLPGVATPSVPEKAIDPVYPDKQGHFPSEDKPYAGQAYDKKPWWVNDSEWEAKGGTLPQTEDYRFGRA